MIKVLLFRMVKSSKFSEKGGMGRWPSIASMWSWRVSSSFSGRKFGALLVFGDLIILLFSKGLPVFFLLCDEGGDVCLFLTTNSTLFSGGWLSIESMVEIVCSD